MARGWVLGAGARCVRPDVGPAGPAGPAAPTNRVDFTGTIPSTGAQVWLTVTRTVFGTTEANPSCAVMTFAHGTAGASLVDVVPGFLYHVVVMW